MLTLAEIALFVLALAVPASCDDTVADDIGIHMIDRLSELLSPEECQAFYVQITGPEENVEQDLERLSEEKNPIHTRKRRDITSMKQCKDTLSQWLDTEGDAMYWDRLSQALQAIGRSDISKELGKNLNQDKNLEIKKNVEGYHETVKQLTSSFLLEENVMSENEGNGQGRLRRDGERSESGWEPEDWDDLELIIERKPQPPYMRSLFEWATPVTIGFVGGFLSSFVVAALALYSFFWILNQGSLDPIEASQDSIPDMIFHSPSPRRGGIYYTPQVLDELWKDDSGTADEGEDDDIWEKELLVQP